MASEERHLHAEPSLGGLDGIAPQRGVGLHDLELVGREACPGLSRMRSGMPTLPMSCSGADLNSMSMVASVRNLAEARVVFSCSAQRLDVVLGAADVVAGVVVARFRQRGHGQDGDVLDRVHLARAPGDLDFQEVVLVAQEVGRRLERELGRHPRQDDGRADRLGDVVHRAQFQALLLVLDLGHGGQEDDRDVTRLRVGLELLADLVAVHAGHHDVEQDQVGRGVGPDDLQRLLAVVGDLDPVVVLEQVAHQRRDCRACRRRPGCWPSRDSRVIPSPRSEFGDRWCACWGRRPRLQAS